MECDICGRVPSTKLPFHCPTCARSVMYPLRIEQATILLNRESMGQKVEAVVQHGSTAPRENISLSGAIIDTAECGKAYELERIRSETTALEERVNLIAERAEALHKEMQDQRSRIASKKAEIKQRKSDAESANYKLEERSAKEIDAVQSSIRRRMRRWEMEHQTLIADRRFFCTTAATAAGLKRGKRTENGRKVEYFTLGANTPIFDLRDLNGAHPNVLTASLTQVAYLTVRVSTYLALRLPAEITLPHRDYPLPTIFSPPSSYLSRDIPFPGHTPTQSSLNSPAGSKILDGRPLPKPRPLFVYDELPKLAKKDATAFSMFVEGVTLLAWDIAWICKTQGLTGRDGYSSWTEICAMGRNLWQLLLAEPKPANSRRSSTTQRAESKSTSGAETAVRTNPTRAVFGQYSHGTAHSFLGSAEGGQLMQDWKQSPARTVDKVKAHLLAEMQGAEWEVVHEKEWDGDDDLAADEAVLVGGSKWRTTGGPAAPGQQPAAGSSSRPGPGRVESAAREPKKDPAAQEPAQHGREATSKYQGNGWMKVRQRSAGGSANEPEAVE